MSDPNTVLDRTDPGDDTQLRFRYQHGYGVILLCGAAAGELPYVAVWCEHHEDLLGEKSDGQFDSVQVKTRKPELGPWKMSSDKLVTSIGRFVELDRRFPGKFDAHSFVSNAECYDTDQAEEVGKSPIKFFNAVQNCTDHNGLTTVFVKVLQDLSIKLSCDKTVLFETCKRVRIVKGPSLDGFESSIAHEHLPALNECSMFTPAELDALRDELIQMVFNASSVSISDPSKHWCCVLGHDHINPRLRAKRLAVSDTVQDALAGRMLVFRFSPSSEPLKLGYDQPDREILAKKLLKGGMATQLGSMQSRALSAEQYLLAMVARDADQAGKVINQVREVVQGTCVDAAAIASANPEPWGVVMYRRVVSRLEDIADKQPNLVYHLAYDCLMGVAGLLTEECKVWWSPEFDVKESV